MAGPAGLQRVRLWLWLWLWLRLRLRLRHGVALASVGMSLVQALSTSPANPVHPEPATLNGNEGELHALQLKLDTHCHWSLRSDVVASRIVEIVFEGNEVTRPKVMRREILIHEGAAADPALIERSRQAIEDLGLFRQVDVRQERMAEGVRVVFKVHEKWYWLPIPRLGYDSDQHLTYGGQLALSNLQGLNQTLKFNLVKGNSADATRGQEQTISGAYLMPFVADSRWALDVSGSHRRSPVVTPSDYQESFDAGQVLMTRALSDGLSSQGWQAGGGILWQNEQRSGSNAPPSYGAATALVGLASYRNVRYEIYSEEGMSGYARSEIAARHALSDYGYEKLTVGIRQYQAMGHDPYQSLNFFADAGARLDGPADAQAFSLGGRAGLRAYGPSAFQGNAFYRMGAEYLHPLYWNSLRGLVILETGNAFDKITNPPYTQMQTSLGVGVRLRVAWLVNFEVELGVAVPLNHFSQPRMFGGRL